jgi:hypothetical protein
MGVTPTSLRISSISSCRLVAGGYDFGLLTSRQGDVEEGRIPDGGCWVASRQQGSTEAALGRASEVARLWLPSSMVEGQPPRPPLPALVFSAVIE